MPLRNIKSNLPIIVVGGGPSGLLAAITAADSSNRVILVNKNPWPGKKVSAIPHKELILTEKLPAKKLAASFNDKADFVSPLFKSFGYTNLVRMFKKMKMKLEVDQTGHYRANGLPSKTIIQSLLDEAINKDVEYRKSSRVTDVYLDDNHVAGVVINSDKIPASAVILATGSFSSPKYGSTKDGYRISERLGHRVNEIRPALINLITVQKYGKVLEGETIKDITISIFFDGKIAYSELGDLTFSLNTISGPMIWNHSAEIIEKLSNSTIELRIDFMPEQPRESFEEWLTEQFHDSRHLTLGNFMSNYFNDKIIRAIEAMSRIKLDKSIIHITKLERKSLVHTIKDFRLTIKAPKPFNFTRGVLGGVSTDDINPQTCESKIVKSLYFAGDIIDVLGPWGGYNMQFAFSSGYVAGKSAADNSN